MKSALRQGGGADLSVYTVGFTNSGGLTGYGSYPLEYPPYFPTEDGVVILYSIVPGGAMPGINEGKTLTHETGHWLGLYYTFQGGCFGSGDQVADTEPEDSAATVCPIGRGTCRSGGVDPIHNFMDYTNHACKTEFTPGQFDRIREQISVYRGIWG